MSLPADKNIIDDADLRPVFEVSRRDGVERITGATIEAVTTDYLSVRSVINFSGQFAGLPSFSSGLDFAPSPGDRIYLRPIRNFTASAASTPLYTFTTTNNATYTVSVRAAIKNQTTGTSTGSFSFIAKASNTAGVVTVSAISSYVRILDAALSTANMDISATGGTFSVVGIGVAATNIEWLLSLEILEIAN